ncbi:T9SS type A sorting domain-containing protein [Algibacter sp. Ld11]|uniref:T9SS type A sorting domain-containing protein n=1 Tax=Algibacter sp. Ld11 TaxID=649150 RepID=UPI00386E3285
MRKLYAFVLTVCFSILSFGQNDKSWAKMASIQNETFYDVQAKFNKYWENKTPEKGQGYKIFKRWENQIADKIYPSGDMSLPSHTYPNFIEWQQKYNNKLARNANSKMKATLTSSQWVSLNQNTIASGYDSGSGRLNFVTFHPTNASIMYVGAPDGGLWKTVDAGVSWTTNSDYLPIIGCSGLVIHPTNPDIMYLATGDRESDRRSIGVLKTTDGGANWNTTALTWTALDHYKITKIVMDPNDPDTMMVATDGGIFTTTDGWNNYSFPTTPIETFYDIEYKPASSTVIYAASTELYKSTDGGLSWTVNANISGNLPAASAVTRIELAVTPADADYVYAIVGNTDQGLEGFYRSTDSGVTYTKQSTASTPNILHASAAPMASSVGGQADHDLAIAVSPKNEDLVTIGGINQWQTTDGGANWTRITYWLGTRDGYPYDPDYMQPEPYIHADIIYIAYSPHDNTALYTACDGGIYKGISDGQSTWENITANIAVGQQTNIALSPTDVDTYFAGLQDIGTIIHTATGGWSILGGGDGEDGFIARGYPMILSSTTNGEFQRKNTTTGNVSFYPSLNSEWFSPIKQDPVDDYYVYLGGRPALYGSDDIFTNADDVNPTWTELGTPQPGKNILSFEIAPSDSKTIYAITDDRLSKSGDYGETWANVTGTLPVASAKLKNLTVSNIDANKVWVVFSGYVAGEKVYKTTDGGATWINVSNGLPNIPMNTIVYRKNSLYDEVYVGADLGVYAIDNLVSSAVPFLTDLPKCAVQDLEIFYPTETTGILRAATYGRGSWQATLGTDPLVTLGTDEVTSLTSSAPILYPNPVSNGVLNVKLVNTDSNYVYYLYNLLGEQVLKGTLDVSNSVISLKDKAAGTYILRLISDDKMYTQKVLVK